MKLPPAALPPAFHADRRRLLARKIQNGVVILAAAPVFSRGRDAHYHPYAPDPFLRYLSGMTEPHSALLLVVRNGALDREVVFCRPRDPAAEQWDGERLGPERAAKSLGIAEGMSIEFFGKTLREAAADFSDLWFIPGAKTDLDARIINLVKIRRMGGRAGMKPVGALRDVSVPLDEMRMIKTPAEIAAMRESAAIVVDAVSAAMRAAKSARYEREIEAVVAAEFRRRGGHHAFPPIVAAGANACCLHYTRNDARVRRDDLILLDAGCETRGYCSDITRVFPAGGAFSAAQKDAVAVVLDAHKKALDKVRPGGKMDAPEKAAARAIAAGLRELKLLRAAVESILERGLHRRFYMHRVGHFLGMDAHDPGRMADGAFAAGMVLTIEPGIYIPDAPDIPKPLRGIGVRIEDDVLVTADGRETLTDKAPRTPREVEAMME